VWPVAADVVVVACGGTLLGARPHRTLAAVAVGWNRGMGGGWVAGQKSLGLAA